MNKNSKFYKVLVKVEAGIKRMSEQAAAVRWYLEADDIETAYEKAIKLEAVTEKTTLLTRLLTPVIQTPQKRWMKSLLTLSRLKWDSQLKDGFALRSQLCFRRKHPDQQNIFEHI